LNTIRRKITKICAVVPFYNEKDSINKLIERTVPFIDKLILVNDGSTDGTESIINFSDKIILINFKNNLGKGAALTAGFNESIKYGYDVTITLDADLQHPPEEIPNFIREMEKYDILIGNRLNNIKNMPLQRVFSNKLTSFFMSLKTKIKLPDTQCGFRAYRNDALKNILPKSKGYEAESEIIINAARQNYRIGFIKIPTIYANEKSKMKPVETIIGFIKILFI